MDLLGEYRPWSSGRDHRLVVGASDGDDDIARGGGVIVGTGIVLHRDGVSDSERLAFTQKIERAIGDLGRSRSRCWQPGRQR